MVKICIEVTLWISSVAIWKCKRESKKGQPIPRIKPSAHELTWYELDFYRNRGKAQYTTIPKFTYIPKSCQRIWMHYMRLQQVSVSLDWFCWWCCWFYTFLDHEQPHGSIPIVRRKSDFPKTKSIMPMDIWWVLVPQYSSYNMCVFMCLKLKLD